MRSKPKLFRLMPFVILFFFSSVRADDWGCQVLLCLSNPNGPEAVAECVPPIQRLWQALSTRPPQPFPTCDIGGAERSNFARHQWASSSFCPSESLYWQSDGDGGSGQWLCSVTGGVTVVVDGRLQSRVWWQWGKGAVLFQPTTAALGDEPTTALERLLRRQEETRRAYQND